MPLRADDTNEETPLERLRKRLYSPKSVDGIGGGTLTPQTPSAPQHWQPAPLPPAPPVPKTRLSLATLFLLGAAGFFILAGIVTAVVLFLGARSVSADHLSVRVEGPTNVAGGDPVPMLITITNENPLPVTGGTLTVDFPDGTVDPDTPSVPLTHYTEELGVIAPGDTVRLTVRASFFGSENQRIAVPVTIEYQTENSNATFTKQEVYTFTISTSPVSLTVTTLSEVSSGQSVTVAVRVRSNADAPLSNVAVEASYPFGFSVTQTSPAPTGPLFVLGTLSPGEEKEIKVTGTLSGQDGDERVFRFTAGSLLAEGSRDFGVSYTVADSMTTIAKPFLTVGMTLNREETPNIVLQSAQTIDGSLLWSNSLATPITDARISVAIAGEAFDPNSVVTTGGFFRSSDNTIVFDRETTAGLARLQPGDTGNGSFQISMKSGNDFTKLRNPSITLTVSVSGKRTSAGQVPENVTSTITRTVKIASALSLSSRVVRTTGAFTNTGPWPPVADQETTYTVELTAANTVNTVAGAKVTVPLPSYVRFVAGNPTNGVSFSEATRTVTWTVGDMAPGATKTGSFQIAFLPSASQKGTSPILVMEQKLTGVDRFVQQELSATAPSLNTQATNDPGYQIQYGSVQ